MEAIALSDVTFTYSCENSPALRSVDLKINEGELCLLCGRSGSGKTTLLKLLKPQITPFGELKGSIEVFGKPIKNLTDRESAADIGFVMQSCDSQLVTESVWRELAFGLESLGADREAVRSKTAETAMFFGIEKLYHRSTSELSGGEKQLINLASIMACEPKVLLLDEPTSQLDPIAAKNLIALIRRLNKELGLTIVISEHRPDDIFAYADRVVLIDSGRVVGNTSAKAAAQNESFPTAFLPTPARVFRELGGEKTGVCAPLDLMDLKRFVKDKCSIKEVPETKSGNADHTTSLVRLRDVYYRYTKQGEDVLKGLTLDIYKGEILCILGGNGAGKSTLLKAAAGIYKPYSGKVQVKQKNCGAVLLPQDTRELFLKQTVVEDIIYSAIIRKASEDEARADAKRLCSLLGLADVAQRHPFDLSGGEMQRAAIAKLLALKPSLLLLDEPTKGMPYDSKIEFCNLVKKLRSEGVTIVIVTHDTQTAAECSDRCALMFDGKIISYDTPENFFSRLTYYTTPESALSRAVSVTAVTLKQLTDRLDIR